MYHKICSRSLTKIPVLCPFRYFESQLQMKTAYKAENNITIRKIEILQNEFLDIRIFSEEVSHLLRFLILLESNNIFSFSKPTEF